MGRRFIIFVQCVVALFVAWGIKLTRSISRVRLPSVREGRGLSEGDIAFVKRCADAFTRYGAARTGRKCFFRAFILASVLRRWGLPLVMNVGMGNLGPTARTEGHCWLTTPDGQPFAEPQDPRERYPFLMGNADYGVRYWAGP